ncbi:MAG: hypothetical protein QOF56_4276 [Acidobacteriaceae bacterium]|nr:hypothetical protein [Acidobacteriaceae bacterium]
MSERIEVKQTRLFKERTRKGTKYPNERTLGSALSEMVQS